MGFPPVQTFSQEITYTTLADLTEPTPGTRRMQGGGRVSALFAAVDTGNEPSGADLEIDVLLDGVTVGTAVIEDGDQEGLVAVSPAFAFNDGALLTFANLVDGGATGPLNVGLRR